MALKLLLKPKEKVVIGRTVLVNSGGKAEITILGDEPILREKDIMTPEAADTPCKRIYLALQLMYLARNPMDHQAEYFRAISDVIGAAPSLIPTINAINDRILEGRFYLALKETRDLIAAEEDLLANASQPA